MREKEGKGRVREKEGKERVREKAGIVNCIVSYIYNCKLHHFIYIIIYIILSKPALVEKV